MRRPWLAIALAVVVASAAGDAVGAEAVADTLWIPIGRSAVVAGNEYAVFVDGVRVEPRIEEDGFGGYWACVGYEPGEDSEVTVRFVTCETSSAVDSTSIEHDWLAPSRYIDSEDELLAIVGLRATEPYACAVDRAVALQAFVADKLDFRIYENHSLDPASRTYELGYGTCVNHARLFVALSRAAGIPARTVWGVVHNDGVFDYHHEWAEVRDEDGRWHQLDPVHSAGFGLASAEYLDLVYAPEENPLNPYQVDPAALTTSERIVYDVSPQPHDGRLGFALVEHDRYGRYVIENTYTCPCASGRSPGA
jgi:transglutaminase-like putative cysteine protease